MKRGLQAHATTASHGASRPVEHAPAPAPSTTAHSRPKHHSSLADLKLHLAHTDDNCVAFAAFYNGRVTDDIPPRLQYIAGLLVDKFDPNIPWTTQVIDSFRDGFLTAKEMRGLLYEQVDRLTLRQMLLHFYWFFRGIHMCDQYDLIADRLLQLDKKVIDACKLFTQCDQH